CARHEEGGALFDSW
nr:immunoglobulin heavy chain junction region [Macaca mulatta]MOW81343.1 immunoglobulin heavy chain junction region [Macaca mulatta]MOW82110.1 immunoglobulin heavy chain junction region [Macaca mulatta]MOW83193.1 immunoglobulin heavy chain junction region [Macaca mulatta]MOW85758.1 immunoglobulin heavy chain junction region [Macaca mulatta]